MERGRARVTAYEQFLSLLDEDEKEQAAERCGADIGDIRERLAFLEAME